LKEIDDTNKPYLIRKDAFGESMPTKDIHISGHHRILSQANDNMFLGIQAYKIDKCEKESYPETQKTVTYYHIVLENDTEGIIVNNLPLESCQTSK